ncbi:MAG: retropepsin-like aspartic protease [Candidatus Bathyarchaeia archaeon]
MVKVRDKIGLSKDGRRLEVIALFDTGSGGSYLSDQVAERIGYERYPQPRRIPLAVRAKEAELIGYVPVVDVEVAGYVLPEKETLGVIKDLYVDAIIGLNLIGKYNIILEKDRIGFKEYPPRTFLF